MRKATVYMAVSLDGYIADKHGGVDWLGGNLEDSDSMGSYPQFIETIDTIILGYKTYHQIKAELSPNKWIYQGKTSYVVTHRMEPSTPEIRFVSESPAGLIARLKAESGKDIWICGGASMVNQLMASGLIDRFHFTVIPIILGDGIRLFEPHPLQIRLRLVSTTPYGDMVDLVYEPINQTV